jgi:hypothetical protein
MNTTEALAQLKFSARRKYATMLGDTIKSAVRNASHNFGMDAKRLLIGTHASKPHFCFVLLGLVPIFFLLLFFLFSSLIAFNSIVRNSITQFERTWAEPHQ